MAASNKLHLHPFHLKEIENVKNRKENSNETRPILDWFQDFSKNWSLNQEFCFYGCKKDVMITMSFKVQTNKNAYSFKEIIIKFIQNCGKI